MRGTVNVSGATVVAEHTPTGITKTTSAGSSGSFSLSFLPIGGPYTVKVSAPGNKALLTIIDDVELYAPVTAYK